MVFKKKKEKKGVIWNPRDSYSAIDGKVEKRKWPEFPRSAEHRI